MEVEELGIDTFEGTVETLLWKRGCNLFTTTIRIYQKYFFWNQLFNYL
jgi:hypothetical protein